MGDLALQWYAITTLKVLINCVGVALHESDIVRLKANDDELLVK